MIKDLKKGTPLFLRELAKEAHKTAPPPRFSEVKLISELEDRGIGRPATFSSIVSLIQDRGYVVKKGNQLIPTFLGFAVVHLLTTKFPSYTDYTYTAQMEDNLEDIASGKVSRENFLDTFWNGPYGFKAIIDDLTDKINYEEIKKLSTIDLHNGFEVTFNKWGAFLNEVGGPLNEKGYPVSSRLDESWTVDDVADAEVCRKLLENAVASQGAGAVNSIELGTLAGGPYDGWTVEAKNGKFGSYIKASNPKDAKAKPINQKLPEGSDISTVKLEDAQKLYSEVKLPRNISDNFFVGVNKKDPTKAYLGYKKTAKSKRAEFTNLPEEFDPRTVTLDQVKKVWEDAQS